MRQAHCTLTSAAVRRYACRRLLDLLPWQDFRRSLRRSQILDLLLFMAVWGRSLFAAVGLLKFGVSHETARQALRAQLLPPEQLTSRLVAALQADLPRRLRRRSWRLAIDLHRLPFYGDRRTPGLLGGQAQRGTKYFWTYATAVLLHHGRRWTVGLIPVTRNDMLAVLQALHGQLQQAQVRIRCLLLDRGFFAAPVISWLQQQAIPFVIPVVRKGRKAQGGRPAGGTEALFGQPSGPGQYSWKPKKGAAVTVAVRVVRPALGRRRPRRRKVLVFAYGGLTGWQAAGLAPLYRRRFGIESSYRQLRQCLGRTGSGDARLRLLLVGLALLVRNLWVWLHWEVLAQRRRGGRQVRLSLLTLQTVCLWIVLAVAQEYGLVLEIQTQRGKAP
jgi:hypothetical protein